MRNRSDEQRSLRHYRQPTGMQNPPLSEPMLERGYSPEDAAMDLPLLVIILLLGTTLTAFISGVIPYPIGWIVLSAFLIARLLQLSGRR